MNSKVPKSKLKRFRHHFWRNLSRRAGESPIVSSVLARFAIWYLKLVFKTNTFEVEPPDILEKVTPKQPVIVAVWHGQHFLMPAIPIGLQASAMISRSLDGEVISKIVKHFGNKTIRASGGRRQKRTLEKGGIAGFLEMINALEAGDNVLQTADIPKGTARRVGLGIIYLAQRSGRPIVPFAIASSRRFVFRKSWDKTVMNLPFGKSAICVGELVKVPKSADDGKVEEYRKILEDELNRVTKQANELTGNPE